MIYLLPFIGAIISRLHGAGALPKVIMGLLWGLPFAYAVWLYNPWLSPVALAMCALGKNTGHGNWFDLATMPQGTKERLEFIIRPLYGKIPEYWYDVIGLTIKGFVSVSGTLLLIPYNPLLALAFAIGGLMSSLGYMIGWKLWTSPKSTEFGEYWTGFFAFVPFILI